jgi:glycosyltransferase involved in cell wall biosynthesis
VRLNDFGIKRDIKVIPWGADPSMFSFSYKQRGEILEVLHVANIHPVKDQPTLLRAFALVLKKKPARLRIFGLDCMNGEMKKLCSELGIEKHVWFEGVVRYEELPKYYKTANLMLHTSLSEAQCMALTEAVATGVLIAGTKVGLLYEIGEKCGLSVEVGDYEGLAKKVLYLCEKPDEWNRKVEGAKSWSDNHSFDWTIKKLTELLLTVSKTLKD